MQSIVNKYETCELTEVEAAALAFEYYQGTVLIHVFLTLDYDADLIATNTPLVQA